MSAVNARNAYRRTQVNTSNPVQLAAMLCAGAVKFADQAQQALEQKNLEACHNHLLKAQACVTELQTSLDMERGGEVARQLAALYEYASHRFTEANIHKDAQAIQEAREVMSHLRESWTMLLSPAGTEATPGGGPQTVPVQ